MASKNYPKGRDNDIILQDLNGEVLIYDLQKNKVYCLNETSALVWGLCDGTKSIPEISQSLGKKLNLPANEDIVWLALDKLKQSNLITNGEGISNYFAGMSRREVIKKVGLGTMIGLPLITGLIAPTSTMAQSGVPLANGATAGTFVVPSVGNCGNCNSTCRNTSCDTNFGALCASGNATNAGVTPTCTNVPGNAGYSFGCVCAA